MKKLVKKRRKNEIIIIISIVHSITIRQLFYISSEPFIGRVFESQYFRNSIGFYLKFLLKAQ